MFLFKTEDENQGTKVMFYTIYNYNHMEAVYLKTYIIFIKFNKYNIY